MGKMRIAAIAGCLALLHCAPKRLDETSDISTPRLVVIVTIDQMRDDQLDRFAEDYRGGLRRLLDGGLRFSNAWVDHAPTNSGPGHATIATGVYPRRHGVIDNSWKEQVDGEWRRVYSDDLLPGDCKTDDETLENIGFAATTLGERVLKQGGEFVAISAGREVAKHYAGRSRAPIIWLSPEDGGFRTSHCYLGAQPEWLLKFNEETLPQFVSARWDLSLSDDIIAHLRPDDSPFEGEGDPSAFPHLAPADAENPLLWFYDTPFADEALLALARAAVEAEGLGLDETPDLVNVVVNTIDNVGHKYGPFSVEQADNLFRLDAALGVFMDALDEKVGEGRWLLVLTADHGAPPAPEAREAAQSPSARRISEEEVGAVIAAAHAATIGFAPDDPARIDAVVEAVETFDFIDRALTQERIAAGAAEGDEIAALYDKSRIDGKISRHPLYDAEGRGLAEFGVIPLLAPNVVIDWATSIHGSPYDYDRKVPMVFYGGCIVPGISGDAIRTVDVASTISNILEIDAAGGFDGEAVQLERLVSEDCS